jgi:hypothetical protein
MAPVDDSTRAHTVYSYVDACRVVRIIPKLAERILNRFDTRSSY